MTYLRFKTTVLIAPSASPNSWVSLPSMNSNDPDRHDWLSVIDYAIFTYQKQGETIPTSYYFKKGSWLTYTPTFLANKTRAYVISYNETDLLDAPKIIPENISQMTLDEYYGTD